MNVTLAMEANEKPIPPKKSKDPTPAERNKYNRQLEEMRKLVYDMRSSPAEYAKTTGYAALFGLEEPVKEEPRTKGERAAEAWETARRVLKRVMGGGSG